MNIALRLTLLIFFVMTCFSCSPDDGEVNWAVVICEDLDIDDNDLLKADINNYLESIDPNNTSVLINEFAEWLNDLTCTSAILECQDCINTEPPSSLIKLMYILNGDSLTKNLVILSFEEAQSIRLSEIR